MHVVVLAYGHAVNYHCVYCLEFRLGEMKKDILKLYVVILRSLFCTTETRSVYVTVVNLFI